MRLELRAKGEGKGHASGAVQLGAPMRAVSTLGPSLRCARPKSHTLAVP